MSQKSPMDPLTVLDFLASSYVANRGTKHQFIKCVTPPCHGDDAAIRKSDIGAAWLDLIEARAAVAELVEAAKQVLRKEWEFGDEQPHCVRLDEALAAFEVRS